MDPLQLPRLQLELERQLEYLPRLQPQPHRLMGLWRQLQPLQQQPQLLQLALQQPQLLQLALQPQPLLPQEKMRGLQQLQPQLKQVPLQQPLLLQGKRLVLQPQQLLLQLAVALPLVRLQQLERRQELLLLLGEMRKQRQIRQQVERKERMKFLLAKSPFNVQKVLCLVLKPVGA